MAKRGVLQLHHPMEHGVVRRPADVAVWSHNWDDLMAVWRHTYGQLGVATSRQPVLVSEAPLNPREHRQRMTHALFEDLDVPAMFVETQAVLALYASGRSTGTVVDCGDGVTHVVPVYGSCIATLSCSLLLLFVLKVKVPPVCCIQTAALFPTPCSASTSPAGTSPVN